MEMNQVEEEQNGDEPSCSRTRTDMTKLQKDKDGYELNWKSIKMEMKQVEEGQKWK